MLIEFDSACDTFSIDTLWSSRAAHSSERSVTQTGWSLGYDSPLWESTPFQTIRTQDGSFASLDAKPGCHLLICWEATMIATSGVASGCWGKLFRGSYRLVLYCFTPGSVTISRTKSSIYCQTTTDAWCRFHTHSCIIGRTSGGNFYCFSVPEFFRCKHIHLQGIPFLTAKGEYITSY